MSTEINVTVDSGGLLERSKLQAAANRQAFVEGQQRAKAEQTGKEQRLAEEGRDAQGRLTLGGLPAIERYVPEPAARRQGLNAIVNGFGFSYSLSEYNFESNTEDLTIKIRIAPPKAANATEFVFPGPTLDSSTEASDLPSRPSLPPYLSGYGRPMPTNSTTQYFVGEGNHYNVRAESASYYVVPDGTGGAYLVFYSWRVIRKHLVRAIATRSIGYSLIGVTQALGDWYQISPPSDPKVVLAKDVAWSMNPGCILGQIIWDTDDPGPPPELEVDYFWTGTLSEQVTVSTLYDHSVDQQVVGCFHVTDQQVTQIATPASLQAKLETLSPKGVLSSSQDSASNLAPSIQTGASTWDGQQDSNCNPIYTPASYSEITKTPITVLEYINPAAPIDYDPTLSFYLGGAEGSPKAWSPAAGISLLNGPADITVEQATDYAYMQSDVLQKRPRAYVTACPVANECSDSATYWYGTKRAPENLGDGHALASLRKLRNTPFMLSPPLQSGDLQVVYHTNWGNPGLCRSLVSALGLSQ